VSIGGREAAVELVIVDVDVRPGVNVIKASSFNIILFFTFLKTFQLFKIVVY
jgi:hypothetical protein